MRASLRASRPAGALPKIRDISPRRRTVHSQPVSGRRPGRSGTCGANSPAGQGSAIPSTRGSVAPTTRKCHACNSICPAAAPCPSGLGTSRKKSDRCWGICFCADDGGCPLVGRGRHRDRRCRSGWSSRAGPDSRARGIRTQARRAAGVDAAPRAPGPQSPTGPAAPHGTATVMSARLASRGDVLVPHVCPPPASVGGGGPRRHVRRCRGSAAKPGAPPRGRRVRHGSVVSPRCDGLRGRRRAVGPGRRGGCAGSEGRRQVCGHGGCCTVRPLRSDFACLARDRVADVSRSRRRRRWGIRRCSPPRAWSCPRRTRLVPAGPLR